MDERLSKALEFSHYMVTLNNQKRLLKEKFNEDIVCYFGGGQFTASQDRITFCQSMIALNQTEMILIDDNGIPVNIPDLQAFLDILIEAYFSATNEYLSEYNRLKSNRSVKGIVNL